MRAVIVEDETSGMKNLQNLLAKYCEHIEELPDFGADVMSKKLFKKAKKFKEMTGFSFEIYGICNSCKRK